MKTLTISAAVAFLAAIASAAPAPAPVQRRDTAYASVTFEGAPPDDAYFTMSIPVYSSTSITNSLSISHISVGTGAGCYFSGIDGGSTVVHSGQTIDVGPPQTQVSAYCWEE
ncbi:MAG: hypothetical protein M1834_006875 [Cirrosporium novae-zelandiae]|nr:MAG: hypothetical protein M1834_006875 [Cirrosporium novae-zelandiae]